MKFKMKRLAATAILFSSASMLVADDNSSSSVGDLPGFGEDAYFDVGDGYFGQADVNSDESAYAGETDVEDDASYQHEGTVAQASVSDDTSIATAGNDQDQYDPINLSALQPVGYQVGGVVGSYLDRSYGSSSCDCDGGCDGGCDSASCFSAASCISKGCCLGKFYDCNTWATYEALLWFPQNRYSPALVTSAAAGQLPVLNPGGLPAAGVNILAGGEIDGGLSAGFRADYGRWVSKNVGIGGRFWWIDNNRTELSLANLDGSNGSIGRPFFEINPAAPNGVGESALLIAYDDGTTILTGNVNVRTELQMLGAEAYGRFRLGCSNTHQLDLVGGYSYFRINDGIAIVDDRTTIASPPLDPPPGTFRLFGDLFEAKNRFNGGQVGFDLSASRGCWTVRSLTKVHMGNMNQRIEREGLNFISIGGAPGVGGDTGFLVGDNNSGSVERDVFTFAPEMNFKLSHQFRDHVALSVGYSFIYFDNVALAGNTIDRAVDGPAAAAGGSGARPAPVFREDSLWVHGIDLGVVIDF